MERLTGRERFCYIIISKIKFKKEAGKRSHVEAYCLTTQLPKSRIVGHLSVKEEGQMVRIKELSREGDERLGERME